MEAVQACWGSDECNWAFSGAEESRAALLRATHCAAPALFTLLQHLSCLRHIWDAFASCRVRRRPCSPPKKFVISLSVMICACNWCDCGEPIRAAVPPKQAAAAITAPDASRTQPAEDSCICLQVCQLEARCRALEMQVDELMQSWDEENPDSQFLVRISALPECASHGLYM